MRKTPRFAELIFLCPSCKTEQKLEVAGKIENEYNHDCKCGAKFMVNRTKGKVIHINKESK